MTGASIGDLGTIAVTTGLTVAFTLSVALGVEKGIRRISRGRTVRQVAVTGVLASTGITIPWFATMGGTAIFLQENGRADILSIVSDLGEAASSYPLFEALPLGWLLTVLFLVLVTTFLVTSATPRHWRSGCSPPAARNVHSDRFAGESEPIHFEVERILAVFDQLLLAFEFLLTKVVGLPIVVIFNDVIGLAKVADLRCDVLTISCSLS